MLRKTKVFFSLALILIMLVIFVACSAGTTTTTSPATTAPTTTKPATSAPATTGPTTTKPPVTTTTPASSKVYGGILKMGDAVFPTNIGWTADPAWGRGGHVLPMFYDTLIRQDKNGVSTPNLCSFTVAPDKKSITLALRKGVKFHDGSDWNATAAKWNIDILINAKLGDYKEFKSVDIVDDYTIKINIGNYTNTILTVLAGSYVISKQAFDKNGEAWMKLNAVGTGPFVCTKFEPNVSAKGVKFKDYWQTGKPYLDGVEFTKISDAMTRSAALRTGEIDVYGADLSKVEYDLEQMKFEVISDFISVINIVPDSANPSSPFSKLQVRQAMDYAIDRDAIVKALGYGFWATTYQFALPGTSAFNPALTRPFSIDKAKQLLTEAGFPSGIKTTYTVNSAVSNRDVVTAIAAQLGKAGITVDMKLVDGTTANSQYAEGWTGLQGSASSIGANVNASLTALTKDNPVWFVSMQKDEAFYELYRASITSPDYDPALVQKCIKYFFDNATFNSIYANPRGVVLPPWVHDTGFYTRHRFWYWDPADCWMDKR